MESAFAWLDYSEHERRKVLDVIAALGEEDSRDELGIGGIRDAFADLLFPGTSTIQTRARYFLFVPWIYLRLERSSVPARGIRDRARRDELALIDVLVKSDDHAGTIGARARRSLQRLPSNVYWLGLERWGIRAFHGSQSQYYRSFERLRTLARGGQHNDDGEPVDGVIWRNWHAGLPNPPADFPRGVSFHLSAEESEYLRERIMNSAPGTMLAFLVDKGRPCEVSFPWEHPQLAEFPAHVREQLEHARNFSEVIHGAALLYNLMLAELAARDDLQSRYRLSLLQWQEATAERRQAIITWSRERFWQIVGIGGARISVQTRAFVNGWLDIAKYRQRDLANDSTARSLIHERERLLKRAKARLDQRRALELWNGAAGTARLVYRWPVAQRIVSDILSGLAEETSNA